MRDPRHAWARFARATRQLGGQISNPTIIPAGLVAPDPFILENQGASNDVTGSPALTNQFTGFQVRRTSGWVSGRSGAAIIISTDGFYVVQASMASGAMSTPAGGGVVVFNVTTNPATNWPNFGNSNFWAPVVTGLVSASCWFQSTQKILATTQLTLTATTSFSWTNWFSTFVLWRIA